MTGTSLRLRRGFTLIELMIVVVIVAVLATVAVVSYKKYKRSARRGDGVALMNDIRMKQETFFNTYSRYVSSTADEGTFDGTPMSGDLHGYFRWESTCPDATDPWCQLGFRPKGDNINGDNMLYFQLQTISWAPGVTEPSFVNDTSTHWWSVQARGLPESDDSLCTLMRMSSDSREAITLGEWTDCP